MSPLCVCRGETNDDAYALSSNTRGETPRFAEPVQARDTDDVRWQAGAIWVVHRLATTLACCLPFRLGSRLRPSRQKPHAAEEQGQEQHGNDERHSHFRASRQRARQQGVPVGPGQTPLIDQDGPCLLLKRYTSEAGDKWFLFLAR
jgi:hypothetical protein